MQSHSEHPQFLCPISECADQFKDRPALKYHLKKHHSLSKSQLISQNLDSFYKEQPEKFQVNQRSKIISLNRSVKSPLDDELKGLYDQFESIESTNNSSDFKNSSMEDLSPRPKKLLCLEAQRTPLKNGSACSRSARETKLCDPSDISLASNEASMIKSLCQKLQLENQELKKKLSEQMPFLD